MNTPETGKKSRVVREASSQYFVLRSQQADEEMEPLCSAARFNKPLPADAQTGSGSDQSGSVMTNQEVSVTNQPIKTQLPPQLRFVYTVLDRPGRDPVTT